jgi:hypothetical protein
MAHENMVPTKPPGERRCPTLPARAEFSGEDLELYDNVYNRMMGFRHWGEFFKDGFPPYWAALLHSPPVAFLMSELGRYLTSNDLRDSFSHADREWIDQVLPVELRDNRLVGHHMFAGVSNGIRPEAVRSLRRGADDELTPEELELTQYIRQVNDGSVTDESWRGIVEKFGQRGAVEYTVLIGFIIMIIRIEQAFDAWYDMLAPPDDPMSATTDGEIEALISRFIAGEIDLAGELKSNPDRPPVGSRG